MSAKQFLFLVAIIKVQFRFLFPQTTTNASAPRNLFGNLTAKNQTTIPASELERIRMSTLINSFPQRERLFQEVCISKLELKEKSNLRVKNWPNTLEAKRKKKDEARFERFKAEEEDRRKVDKEEAILQAIKKKEILTRANNQIYEDKAKVRALKSQMLLSDALQVLYLQNLQQQKERELQKLVNDRKQDMERQAEDQYFEYMLEKISEEEQLQQLQEEEQQSKIQQYSEEQKKQHQEMKQKFIKRIQEDKIEGEIIKKQVQEKLLKEIKQKEDKKEKHLQALRDTHKANELLMQFKENDRQRDKIEDQKIDDFAKRKDEILKMRKVREDIKFKDKQAQIQRLIDTQEERLKQLKDTENERIKKQIKEAEQKAEDAERKKIAQIMQLRVFAQCFQLTKANIDKHLAQSIAQKTETAVHEKLESQNFQEFWKTKNLEIVKQINNKFLQDSSRNELKSQNFELKQGIAAISLKTSGQIMNVQILNKEEKAKMLEDKYREEVDDAQKNKDFIEDEEHQFNSWAARAIDEWKNQEKDIKPMLLQMQKFKKISLG